VVAGAVSKPDRIALIVNPAAGKRRAGRSADAAASYLRQHVREVDLLATSDRHDTQRLARQAAERNCVVAAVGGDGTLREVAAGVADAASAGASIGMIPAGTGNDFARGVGIALDPIAAAAQLLEGITVNLDCGRLISHDMTFINIVGCGFDARVASWLNRGKRLLSGRAAYIQGVLRELALHRSMEARVTVDGVSIEGDFLLVAICNAQSYGGGMLIAPEAQLDDGLLDVIAVGRMSRCRFLRFFPRVFSGAHLGLPEIGFLRGRQVRVESSEPVPALVDGDVDAETPLEATVEARALPFRLPRDSPIHVNEGHSSP